MTNEIERFKLAKFFIQVLKDATMNQTVVDPDGQLQWNAIPQEIPLHVTDSNVSIDAAALCPIRFAHDFQLITLGDEPIVSAMSGVESNVQYRLGADLAHYRLMLSGVAVRAGRGRTAVHHAP